MAVSRKGLKMKLYPQIKKSYARLMQIQQGINIILNKYIYLYKTKKIKKLCPAHFLPVFIFLLNCRQEPILVFRPSTKDSGHFPS